ESGMEMQDILTALDQVPEEQKTLLLLDGVEDFSYDDAAKVMGVPTGTVMSRLSRARERMRQMLAGESAIKLKLVI
ncbi:MAG: sigma factor-like helix-turn-helix DNA-binding protein, partial [Thiobacillus sp.]|nr:sigma factor-like helix-turn-helix DNA-binding protein [Thiobacillus sp.]